MKQVTKDDLVVMAEAYNLLTSKTTYVNQLSMSNLGDTYKVVDSFRALIQSSADALRQTEQVEGDTNETE